MQLDQERERLARGHAVAAHVEHVAAHREVGRVARCGGPGSSRAACRADLAQRLLGVAEPVRIAVADLHRTRADLEREGLAAEAGVVLHRGDASRARHPARCGPRAAAVAAAGASVGRPCCAASRRRGRWAILRHAPLRPRLRALHGAEPPRRGLRRHARGARGDRLPGGRGLGSVRAHASARCVAPSMRSAWWRRRGTASSIPRTPPRSTRRSNARRRSARATWSPPPRRSSSPSARRA